MFNPFKIVSKFKMALISAIIGAIAILSIYSKGRVDGHSKATGEAAKDTLQGVSDGSKGAAQARDAQKKGRSPEEGVRDRDRRWK